MDGLRRADDARAADWLLGRADWWTLVRYGPPDYPAYLRIAFEPSASKDVDAPRIALQVLSSFTTTPDRCHAAIWEGWYGCPPPEAPTVPIPNRQMRLFQSSVQHLRDAPALAWSVSPRGNVAPHLAWPEDRAWCFACEVDEEMAFTVGCTQQAAAALALTFGAAARLTPYGAPEPLYRDQA